MPSYASALAPTPAEHLTRVQSDLRMGLPCVTAQGATQAVVVAVEPLTQERLSALRDLFGTPELVLTARRARAVMTPAAAADLSDAPVRIAPPEGAGIDWFRALADPASDRRAGPRGPLHLLRGGEGGLQGFALRLVKSAQLLPAVLLFARPPGATLPAGLDLSRIEVTQDRFAPPALSPVASALFPLQAAESGRLHVFRDPTGAREHYALEIGTPDRSLPVLSRLHSACFTGDVLGSLKCDCGPQLRAALAQMGDAGAGVLLYLNQEGRGIGLANKMRVYDLQAQGFDTVEANHRLGFEDDERDFRIAAVMLRRLGFSAVRLLTNNPAKVQVFRAEGISITEQLPLRVGRNAHNSGYLATKALKSGHAL
ncbi:hypothetical protein P775_24190 [Puniceibacterium antarcticum]|uniref:GTP cyclohydrolase-2 n=1 Tax=Puniceibacterium antarcticum TaxID=1206336 RepID=A0A2G8R6Z4_9RHOB|nr:GTP cyclohydrolase II [Puniceibacterium antarcticum]PIL17307.1 hypothetical protein P775_24190 [Puniceibacterium antarcticum]